MRKKKIVIWCHANTHKDHAFILDETTGNLPLDSLCGVFRPIAIKTYGCLERCPICESKVASIGATQ
jgi:hypothetical protein